MEELGFTKTRVVVAVLLLGLIPAAAALVFGNTTSTAAGVYVATITALFTIAAVGFRHLSAHILRPQREMLRMMEDLRRGSGLRPMPESEVPFIEELTRAVNLTCSAVDIRLQQSMAEVVSLESAFKHVHSVLHALTEGVIVLDREGKTVLANTSARSWLLDLGGPIEGRPVAELLDAELQIVVADELARLREQADEQHRQRSSVAIGDRIVDLTISRVGSNRGVDLGSVVVLVDVTRNHEVSRLKDEFLSNISHELRTPLTNITSFAELLSGMSPEEDAGNWTEFLVNLRQESCRMRDLVDDLLDFTVLESGTVEPVFVTVDVLALVRGAVDAVHPALREKTIIARQIFPEREVQVHTDRRRLEGILRRLLDNAFKFTPEGGEIAVEVKRGAGELLIAIDDSGPGIPADQREDVFDRFAQIGETLTSKPDGTGLGLPSCRKLVELLDGEIRCSDSDLGGACFEVRLPASEPTESPANADPEVTTE